MEIKIKLHGSSKMLSENETLLIELPENSNIGQLRNSLKKLINEKAFYGKNSIVSKNFIACGENIRNLDDFIAILKIKKIKYDLENMKYIYICNHCGQKWKNN